MSEHAERQDVLIVHVDTPLSKEKRTILRKEVADIAKHRLGMTALVVEPGMQVEVSRDLSSLVDAIDRQTQAIQALADSNRQVVDYLLAQEAEEHDMEAGPTYLDGSPGG